MYIYIKRHNKMKKKFLTKNTKVAIKEESPNGLKTYQKIHKEDATINSDALKEIGKKLEDYYGDELKELDPVLKVDREQSQTGDVDVYDVEALGTGMQALKYDDEGSETFKTFMKRMEELNDTSEYDKEFGTKDGFGETDDKDGTYEKLQKASDEYKKNKYDEPNPELATRRVRVTNESKDNKMKRLNFKNEFENEFEMKKLIPEHYKNDGQVFLMDDGVQTFKVRWDEKLNEGTVLSYKNKTMITEDTKKMKKLFNYKYSDSMGKTNDYKKETDTFKNLFESTKGKKLL